MLTLTKERQTEGLKFKTRMKMTISLTFGVTKHLLLLHGVKEMSS